MTQVAPMSVLVLAGGRSRRFGRDKLLEPWRGRPMRDQVIDDMARLSDDVVVLAAHDSDTEFTLASAAGVSAISDVEPWPGPLSAVSRGLRAARHDIVLLVAADMPTLSADVLALLARLVQRDSAAVAALELDGQPQPLPLAMRRLRAQAAASSLVEAGERRLRAILETTDLAIAPERDWRAIDPLAQSLRDVDTQADLAALAR